MNISQCGCGNSICSECLSDFRFCKCDLKKRSKDFLDENHATEAYIRIAVDLIKEWLDE